MCENKLKFSGLLEMPSLLLFGLLIMLGGCIS